MDTQKIIEILNQSKSKNKASLEIYGYVNKYTYDKLNEIINENNINMNHFNKKIKYCLNCGKEILKNKNKYCDNSCCAKHTNKGKKHTAETKIKISNSQKKHSLSKNSLIKTGTCVICGNEFIRYKNKNNKFTTKKCCSSECTTKLKSNISKKQIEERIEKGIHSGWATRDKISYPEQFFVKVLQNNNIKYKHNLPINKKLLGLNEPYNYFLDFYLEDKNIDLEIDGKQHQDRLSHDKKRDSILTNNGFIVYRIKWVNINNKKGKEYIKKEIDNFLQFYNNI